MTTTPPAEPPTLDEILAIINRQVAEDAWDYAILYDFSQLQAAPTGEHMQAAVDHIQVVGANRPRGPVGLILPRPTPQRMLQKSLLYSHMTKGLLSFEVLVTDEQIERWLTRNTGGAAP